MTMRDEQVAHAVHVAMAAPENVLTSMFRAVYDYLETKDHQVLISFARAAEATVRVHSTPGYVEALAAAPTKPGAPGRSVEEIFAEHAPRP